MKRHPKKSWAIVAVLTLALAGLWATPAFSHHSYAMFDQTKVVVWTGVVTQYIGQANHSEIHFYLVGSDGKLVKDSGGNLVDYGIELSGTANVTRQGITAEAFPPGTIFSVKVNPLRDGKPYGSRIGDSALMKCPWKTPPPTGKDCSAVTGSQLIGGKEF